MHTHFKTEGQRGCHSPRLARSGIDVKSNMLGRVCFSAGEGISSIGNPSVPQILIHEVVHSVWIFFYAQRNTDDTFLVRLNVLIVPVVQFKCFQCFLQKFTESAK